jgi:nucleotide-binding universal stress UspA family protein
MKDIQKILVCVDLSDYSNETIEYALTFKKGFGAEVLLLNVINQRDVDTLRSTDYYFPGKIDVEEFVLKVRQERENNLKKLQQEYSSQGMDSIKIQVGEGVPFEEILKTIDAEKADLVIMGNKGRSNLASTLFGSTAEKVFKYSKVPVVSIRSKLLSEDDE